MKNRSETTSIKSKKAGSFIKSINHEMQRRIHRSSCLIPPAFLIFFMLTILIIQQANSQTLTQTVRGTVKDKDSKAPMIGATVVVLGSNPIIGATTDNEGKFRLEKVPVGRHSIKISYLGYEEIVLREIVVTSGKELVINAELEESVITTEEFVVRPTTEKEKPLNDMATVSARTFSVDETQRYAASVNDPGRMVSSFAGVVSTDDGNNEIVIRGNSPAGLLWRLEGIDIPNPNHFANAASSGGGISILSSNLLANSDFMTSAFPAEYGNATSGVFDLHLRKGNNEKREFTGRIGFLGIDLAAEGPFSSRSRASYLINYRYSTLGLLGKLGLGVLGDYVTNFQDLSFNVNVPVGKKQVFTLFGIGGKSEQYSKAKKDSTQWEEFDNKINSSYISDMGAIGLSHTYFLGPKTYLKTVLGVSGTKISEDSDTLNNNYNSVKTYQSDLVNSRYTISTSLNHKFNAKNTVRAGIFVNQLNYEMTQDFLNDDDIFIRNVNGKGSTMLVEAYGQWKYKFNDLWTLNSGLNALWLGLNNTSAIDPRVGLQYQLAENQTLSVGYGLHSQTQLMTTYFYEKDGARPNKNLGFTRAHHFVIGYDRMLSDNIHLKLETYYQSLFNIPIENTPTSTYAVINAQWDFPEDPLENEGTGRNYGVEMTLEHFLNNGFYFMFTNSLYQSKYKGGDGVKRNTRYNGNFASNLLAGKEFKVGRNGKNNVLGFNAKLVYLGGLRYTPVDLEKSQQNDDNELLESAAFSKKLPNYFRPDIRVSYQINRNRVSHMLSLDIQNVINRQNIAGQYYDKHDNEIQNFYSVGMLPILAYRIDF